MSGRDHGDDSDTTPPAPPVVVVGAAVGAVALAAVAVVVTFLLALGAGRVGPDVGLVVVTDPVGRADKVPILVMATGPGRVLPLSGRINGIVVDGTRPVAIVEAVTTGGVHIDGGVDLDGVTTPLHLDVPLSGRGLATSITVAKTPSTTLTPVVGARVYPVPGLVPPRGPAEVVLVDDDGARVVTVDVAQDGRLPDGRLLAVDRQPLTARLRQETGRVAVELVARRATRALVTLTIGGRVRRIEALALDAGAVAEVGTEAGGAAVGDDGDVIVATVSTAIVPGVGGETDLQLVDRRGGLSDADLRRVEPRLGDDDLRDPLVREALGRRLRVDGGAPTPVSPSFAAQRAARRDEAATRAAQAQVRFRVAGAALWLALILVGGLLRARLSALVVAALVVGAVLLGLDRAAASLVAGADLVDVAGAATSGSP